MTNSENNKLTLEQVGDDLFNYAIDRQEVKWLLQRLPEDADVKRSKVEYELQILKIISVGWSISYHLENSPLKSPLSEIFWKSIYDFSNELSNTTGLMIGQDIDYFNILKDRLDHYVDALSKRPDAPEPAVVIGPEFANFCGNADDLFALMTGSKMFLSTVTRVKEYLEIQKLR